MKKGFTIIELLIVISVIAILVGISMPRFKGMQDEGNITKARGELKTLQAAVESYAIHHTNLAPAALADVTASSPVMVSVLPTDPFGGGADYGYAVSGSRRYYVIWSVGPAKNGSAAITDAGVATITNTSSCIYITNGSSTADGGGEVVDPPIGCG